MTRTITISDDVYEALAKIKNYRSFSEVLRSMMKKEGNFNTLRIGFGTRSEEEVKKLRKEIEKIEEEFQKWI